MSVVPGWFWIPMTTISPSRTCRRLTTPSIGATISVRTQAGRVLRGKLLAADVMKKKSVKTVEGGDATIASSKDGVKIGKAKVIATDITTSNGVIHVIDTVLMP